MHQDVERVRPHGYDIRMNMKKLISTSDNISTLNNNTIDIVRNYS